MEQRQVQEQGSSIKPKDRYQSFFYLLMLTLNLGFSEFYFGYCLVYMNTIDFKDLIRIFRIYIHPPTAEGFLTGAITIGACFGSLLTSTLLDYCSRRQCILITNAIAVIATLLLFNQNMITLFLCRLLQGFCVGCYSSLIPMIVKEISPIQISGTLVAGAQVMIAFGIVFAFIIELVCENIFHEPQYYWKIIFLFPLLTILTQSIFIMLVFPFETPKYLITNYKIQQAKELISLIYLQEFRQQILEQAIKDRQKQRIFQSLSQITQKKLDKNSIQKFFSIFIAIHLSVLQQFCGINAVLSYGLPTITSIFPSTGHIISIIINLILIPFKILTSYLLLIFGRKVILQTGTLFGFISLFLVALGFFLKFCTSQQNSPQILIRTLILTGLTIFMVNFGLSLGPVVSLYVAEIVQPQIVAFSTCINWIAASIVLILFPIIKNLIPKQNPFPLFLFFALWCAISYFVNRKYLIETKDKTQEQIYKQYQILGISQ